MKKLGFGFMRLPLLDANDPTSFDEAQIYRMVDAYLAAGFTYFDTAHGYLGGKSEMAIKECLTSKYPRESYQLTNKLTGNYFNSQEEIISSS